jgi:nicotinate-nucleotide adenylyltransferase
MPRQPQRWGAPARRAPVCGRPTGLRLGPGLNLQPGMRVGLFGGSFNPAHEGHAHVAATALERLKLDRLIWLVSPQNPLKSANETEALDRRMAGAAAFAGRREIVSDLETRLGVVYTLDTVRILQARFPRVRFVWVMGSDNLAGFHRWRGWTDLLRTIPVAVIARPGALVQSRLGPAARRFPHGRLPSRQGPLLALAAPPSWMFLRAPLHKASSTALRAARALQPPASPRPHIGL